MQAFHSRSLKLNIGPSIHCSTMLNRLELPAAQAFDATFLIPIACQPLIQGGAESGSGGVRRVADGQVEVNLVLMRGLGARLSTRDAADEEVVAGAADLDVGAGAADQDIVAGGGVGVEAHRQAVG